VCSFFRQGFGKQAGNPTKRAPDAGDSAVIPGSFLRLFIFLAGRLRRPPPSAGNANRWAVNKISFKGKNMNELIQTLSSPVWWFSVVIVGILINLVSAYLKSPIDSRLSKISTWWRQRTEQQKAEQEALMNRLANSEHEQVMASFADLRDRLRSQYYLLMGVFIILIINGVDSLFPQSNSIFKIVAMAFSAVCFLLSYQSFISAALLNGKVHRARKTEEL